MILYPLYHKKSWRNWPNQFRDNWKFHESHICQMATTSNQTTSWTTKAVQCRWNRKQKQQTVILHQPSSTNRHNLSYSKVLFIRPRRTQGNTRVPVVCSHLTKDWLEKRMDWSYSTPYHPLSPKCETGNICPMDLQNTTKTCSQQNICWKSHLHPTRSKQHPNNRNPIRVQQT